jgi:hypothetical protein
MFFNFAANFRFRSQLPISQKLSMDLPAELLCMIFVCLLTDGDPTYIRIRRVCKHWYQIYSDLVRRGYVMSRETAVENFWKYPKFISRMNTTNHALVSGCVTMCMKHNLIQDCKIFVKNNDVNITIPLQQAVNYGRRDYIIEHKDLIYLLLKDGIMDYNNAAYLYYYDVTEVHNLIHRNLHHYEYTFPNSKIKLRVSNHAVNLYKLVMYL